MGLGTAATRDTGTSENNLPILDASGDVDAAVVPIDNTLQVDGSGDLGVNTQQVVQEVSEWVQHFATGDSHDTSGHSGKYQEYTSPNTHRRIGSVQYDFDPENDSSGGGTGKTYQVFILELTGRNVDVVLGSSAVYSGNSQQHRFHFTDGVMINPNVRIGIGLHRTDGGNNEGLSVRFGTESQDSPRESYDDASNDFNFVGRFNHDRPTPSVGDNVGGTTANQIYGNPEIFYQIIHTHASLVGDGNVSAAHISSGSAADGEVLTADGSGGAAWEAAAAGGGGGGSGAVTLTTQTAADKNFSLDGTIQSGQVRDLFDANITLPAGIDDNTAFMVRIIATHGSAEIVLTKALLEELVAVAPVTWSTSATGTVAVNSGATQNVYFMPLGQNRGAYVGRSNEDPLSLLWGYTHDGAITLDMQLLTLTAGSGSLPGNEGEDTTVGNSTLFDETTIDVPSGTWGFVNFGDIGEYRLGEWHRFLVADLTGLTDAADGMAQLQRTPSRFWRMKKHISA